MSQILPLRQVFQLHIQLDYIQPPIWRRLLVDSRIGLPELHHTLQAVMGWYDSHLHEFSQQRTRYGIPDSDFGDAMYDERQFRLDQLLKKPKNTLIYTYDFGDDWQHRITLEAILPWRPDQTLPYCTDGARACPPEDCGGSPGYAEILEVMADPTHSEYEEFIDMLGEEFLPEEFDLIQINEDLLNF